MIKVIKKIGFKYAIAALLLWPLAAFALVYQYDAKARLVHLQQTYPGGVDAIFQGCSLKYATKLQHYQSLGIALSGEELKQMQYRFMAKCIYGSTAYKIATCNVSGQSCAKITLPIDQSTIDSMTKSIAPHALNGQMPSSIY